MTTTFEKQEFNQAAMTEEHFSEMFEKLGFKPNRVDVCFENGCSAYAYIEVQVLNEDKMYAEIYVENNRAFLKVRISDHRSNLERICGGVCRNTISFQVFKNLVNNKAIASL